MSDLKIGVKTYREGMKNSEMRTPPAMLFFVLVTAVLIFTSPFWSPPMLKARHFVSRLRGFYADGVTVNTTICLKRQPVTQCVPLRIYRKSEPCRVAKTFKIAFGSILASFQFLLSLFQWNYILNSDSCIWGTVGVAKNMI